MKTTKILIAALLMTFAIGCSNQSDKNSTNTETPSATTPQEDDKKVKFKFDGEKGELEIETDKADIEINK